MHDGRSLRRQLPLGLRLGASTTRSTSPTVDSWGVLFEDTYRAGVWPGATTLLQMILTAALYMQQFRDPNNLLGAESRRGEEVPHLAQEEHPHDVDARTPRRSTSSEPRKCTRCGGGCRWPRSLRKEGMPTAYALSQGKAHHVVHQLHRVEGLARSSRRCGRSSTTRLDDPFTMSLTERLRLPHGLEPTAQAADSRSAIKQIGLDNYRRACR